MVYLSWLAHLLLILCKPFRLPMRVLHILLVELYWLLWLVDQEMCVELLGLQVLFGLFLAR
jgi:hypothetical protein